MRVLRPLRHDLIAEIGGPDDLVGGVLDLFAFEEIYAVFVTGKLDDMVILFAQCTRDRE